MTMKTRWPKTWDAAKAVLRGKFIAIQSYLKKQETSQINNLALHLKQLEKEEKKTPKVSRRKEIVNIRSEIKEKEMKETEQRSIKVKAVSLRRQFSQQKEKWAINIHIFKNIWIVIGRNKLQNCLFYLRV